MTGRIPSPATAELTLNGRLLYYLEQRRPEECTEVEAAAIAHGLRSLADATEAQLKRPAEEVLAEVGPDVEVFDDDPDLGG